MSTSNTPLDFTTWLRRHGCRLRDDGLVEGHWWLTPVSISTAFETWLHIAVREWWRTLDGLMSLAKVDT
jgi:hypothetical protein